MVGPEDRRIHAVTVVQRPDTPVESADINAPGPGSQRADVESDEERRAVSVSQDLMVVRETVAQQARQPVSASRNLHRREAIAHGETARDPIGERVDAGDVAEGIPDVAVDGVGLSRNWNEKGER